MVATGLISMFIFIVAGFVIFSVIAGFIRHGRLMNQMTDQVFQQARRPSESSQAQPAAMNTAASTADGFACRKCGAALDSDTEISPSGDFKCDYCDSWNNVRQSN
ncbi:MAG: hypothetical protein Fues2KO_14940 [Fuerstiella sp.]